jgi:NADH:ubiquinone oxidoreductase subunit 6 (subunit J)
VSGARKLLLSGAALTALLAFVAIASHAHRPGGGSGGGSAHSPTLFGDYLATIALVIMPIGAVLVVWGLANRRKQAALTGRSSWRRNLIAAGVISALLIVLVVTAENRQGRARRPAVGPTQGAILGAPLGAKGPRKAVKADTIPPHRPRWQWLPVLVLGSLLFGIVVTTAAAVAHGRRNREAFDEEAQLARALGEVLSDSLDDLRAERDPRKAVIRAYARMEQTFAAYGVPREEHETPLEYVARVLDSLHVSSFAVRRLVQLFERAKFSPHTIESSMKDDAIEALAGLRAELEYDRTEAA